MNKQEILKKYTGLCNTNLKSNDRILSALKKRGIRERYIFDNFNIGYVKGNLMDLIGDNKEYYSFFEKIGIIKNSKEVYTNYLSIPIHDENKAIVNIAFYNIHPNTKNRLLYINENGIFNKLFLKNNEEIIFTLDPVETLLLIQQNYPNSSFIIGENKKYLDFFHDNNITKSIFTFDGKAKLFYELTRSGVSTKRISIDFDKLTSNDASAYLTEIFKTSDNEKGLSSDILQEIENGFLFRFPHLSYRVIGNFTESSMRLRATIKAFSDNEVFMDSIELYKNRDRQNFIYNLMDKFSLRDQVSLENDLNQIIDVIEKHIEKKQARRKK